MRIVLHGQQAFGEAVLNKLLERGEDIVAVCCAPTKEGKPEDPLALLAKEKGIPYEAPEGTKCAVCDCLPSKGNGLVFDHHHELKIFRGYCCNSCNRSMGVLGDTTQSLLKALKYLNKTDKLTKEQILEALELE